MAVFTRDAAGLLRVLGSVDHLTISLGIYTELVPVTNYTHLGSSLNFVLTATVVPIMAALVLYEVTRACHKKHGLDIGSVFKEIPPE